MITEEVSIRKVPANSNADRPKSWLIPLLLPGEHRDDFQTLLDAISRDIRPAGFIEELYVNDIAWLVWETIHLGGAGHPFSEKATARL